jgi:hypothetical protein
MIPGAGATSIVLIRTPAEVTAAADSLGTFANGPRQVCKLSDAHGVYLAIAGVDNDHSRHFSVADVVFGVIRNETTFAARMSAAKAALMSQLRIEATALQKSGDRKNLDLLINRDGDSLQVALFGIENGAPVAMVQSFLVREDSRGITVTAGNSARCPGTDCPAGVYIFKLGKHAAIDKYLDTHPGAQIGRAAQAAKMLVQIEINAGTEGVGPPIDVIGLSYDGIHLDAKPGCPVAVKTIGRAAGRR